jgi:hypothetical protein
MKTRAACDLAYAVFRRNKERNQHTNKKMNKGEFFSDLSSKPLMRRQF